MFLLLLEHTKPNVPCLALFGPVHVFAYGLLLPSYLRCELQSCAVWIVALVDISIVQEAI